MAVTLTAEALAEETGTDLPRAERLLAVATEAVQDYAPEAPEAMANEAVIRFAGYPAQAGYGAARSVTIGPHTIEHVTNHAAAFRNCGAAALLTRYRRRRAGAVGTDLPRPAAARPQPAPQGGGFLRWGS